MAITVDQLRAAIEANATGAAPDLSRYASNPIGFAVEVLGVRPWQRQADVLAAVAEHHRVAVKSGHKVGKSTTAAILALWWVCTRAGARVVLIAPTARQVRSILWREVRRLYRDAVIPLGGELFEVPDRGLQFLDGREVIGFATDEAERVAGFSGPAMLFICDEASGITEAIFEAIAGNLAGGGSLLLTSNPTRTSGTFFEAFGRKADFFTTLDISSRDTPNASGLGDSIPGLATAKWCDEMLAEWGELSPLYAVRVLGQFPTQASNAVIGIDLVEAAVARWKNLDGVTFKDLGRLELGLDPARFGDDESVLFARRGSMALEPYVFRQLDGVHLAERVMEVVTNLRGVDEKDRPVIRVDVIGIGASVYDQLRRVQTVEVIAVNVAESATVDTYSRKRDEVWFCLRDWLKAGGSIPPDAKLENELVAPVYTIAPNGKLKVESKDEMKARLKRSPDRADALGLAVYKPALALPQYSDDGLVTCRRTEMVRPSFSFDTWDDGDDPEREEDIGRPAYAPSGWVRP